LKFHLLEAVRNNYLLGFFLRMIESIQTGQAVIFVGEKIGRPDGHFVPVFCRPLDES
jgi:hypothetical protein